VGGGTGKGMGGVGWRGEVKRLKEDGGSVGVVVWAGREGYGGCSSDWIGE